MQRRPLEPIPFNENDCLTPLEKLCVIFGFKSKENTDVLCQIPLFVRDSYNDLFQLIGFNEIPVSPKERQKMLWPERALSGQHPTAFLQFGAEIRKMRHVVFEIWDAHYIVRCDFKENYIITGDKLIYHLDELQIWDGNTRYDIDCENNIYRGLIQKTLRIIANSVNAFADNNPLKAEEDFVELTEVIQNLNDLSDELSRIQQSGWPEYAGKHPT